MDGNELLERCELKTNARLFADLKTLDAEEAATLADALAHLATIDGRHAVEERAYPSLFVYCTRELGYSEAEAYLRIRVARAAREYPRILTMIGASAINISAVARIAPFLNSENYRRLLGLAARRTREELETLVAQLAPQEEKRPVIRALSIGSNFPATKAEDRTLFDASVAAPNQGRTAESHEPASPPELPPPIPDSAGGHSPLAQPGRVLFNFVGSAALHAKFKRAQELMRGGPERVFDAALDALLERKDPWRRMARKEKRRGRAAGATR